MTTAIKQSKTGVKATNKPLTERETLANILLDAKQQQLDCAHEHANAFSLATKLAKGLAVAEANLLKHLQTEKLRADKEAVITTTMGIVTVGMKGNKTELAEIPLIIKALNKVDKGLFNSLAKVSITDMKSYLTPVALAKLTKITRVNKRKVKIELS